MKLYLSTIGIAMAVIAAINIAVGTAPWYYVILAVIWCTALQFLLDGLAALLIHWLPNRYFEVDHPYFQVSESERKLYNRLNVRLWKDRVWELGGLGGFSKSRLLFPNDSAYIEQFIIECNKGVITHRISYALGFLAILTLKGTCALTVAIPVALVNLYLNILPTMVLRYNTPKLQSVLSRLQRKRERAEVEEMENAAVL